MDVIAAKCWEFSAAARPSRDPGAGVVPKVKPKAKVRARGRGRGGLAEAILEEA